MSYNFPKATQTQKLSSLPEDLKAIADELIAKKFNVPEVIERNAHSPSEFGTSQVRYKDESYGVRDGSVYGSSPNHSFGRTSEGIRQSYDPRTRQYNITMSDISERTILEAMSRMDNENIRGHRKLTVGREGVGVLRNIAHFTMYQNTFAQPSGRSDMIGTIFGMDVCFDPRLDYGHAMITITY